jgi:hypothetical protein
VRLARQLGKSLALALVLAVVPDAAASPEGDLAQAKALYADGLDAIKKKDYVTATAKFEEAYRLAPDKHLFNYNIGSSAELAGDCRKAQTAYERFLNLVPKHDRRKEVENSLAKLRQSCAFDEDTDNQITAEGIEQANVEREESDAERKLREALKQTRKSVAMYEAAMTKHGDKAKRFKRVIKAKQRGIKKIEKAMAKNGYELREEPLGQVHGTDTIKGACRQGAGQEERSAELYGQVYEAFEAADIVRVMSKLERQAIRFGTMFENSCP